MKNILKITIFSTLALLAASCHNEYLDPVPKTSLSDLTVFENKERILAQVNGLYDFIKGNQFLGGRYFIYNDIRAENFYNVVPNGVTGLATWSHTLVSSTSEVQNLWGSVYTAINAINIFVDGLNSYWEAGALEGIIDEDEYAQYKSEALTLRAISYFYLLQLYARPYNQNNGANPGLPLRLTAQRSSADNDLARSTVAEVYNQILSDLNTAEPLAILDYNDAELNVTRIHRNTIIAFKTRVYLHQSNWGKVISEAEKIVNGSFESSTGVENALQSNITDVFTSYITSESIFSMPFTTTDQPGTQCALGSYYNPSPTGQGDYSLNTSDPWAVYNNPLFSTTDKRRDFLKNASNGLVYLIKFPSGPNYTDYAPVIRYSEVLLNYSEALVKEGGDVTSTALDLLNAVRGRSNPAGKYILADFASSDEFYTALQTERDIEFIGEGIRNFDILRNVASIPGKYSVSAILPTQSEYVWPIPATELNINSLCKPND